MGGGILNNIINTSAVLIVFMTLFISIGYSAFSSKLLIGDTIANVRANADMRITGLNIESVNDATSNYEEYNVSNISVGVKLPSSTSTATYKLTVTNLGNVEMGIYEITNLPDNLDYELIDYTLQDKICNTNNECSLGITKEFYIKIKYATNGYNSSSTTYDLNLDFNFKQIYTINYEEITNNNYPTSVIQGGNINITFTDPVPSNIIVSINGTELSGDEYTYSNNILTINNVTGNVIIKQKTTYICQRAVVLHTERCGLSSCGDTDYTHNITYGNPTITVGSLTSGDAYDCDVNGDGNYDPETERFYYVSGKDGNENSEYAVLIYYENTTLGVADNSSYKKYDSGGSNYRGPVTAISNLPTVNQWSNVSLSSVTRAITTETGTTSTASGTLPTAFSYTNSSGVAYAARLLTAQEVNAACKITVDSSETSELEGCKYLLENTEYSSESNRVGYWLETPRANHTNTAWLVDGSSARVKTYAVNIDVYIGVRPVIEVLKSNIDIGEIKATTFTFESNKYSVPIGMTWGEFATSSYYNTSLYGENIMDYPIYNSSGTVVSGDDQIEDGGTYNYKTITFTFEDTKYTAYEGMTWSNWINSSYNTSEFGKNIMNYRILDGSNWNSISNTDEIKAGGTYEYAKNTFYISYDNNYDEYTAPAGMTWGEWATSSYNTFGSIDDYDIYDEINEEYVSKESTIEDLIDYRFELNERALCELEGGYWTAEGEIDSEDYYEYCEYPEA